MTETAPEAAGGSDRPAPPSGWLRAVLQMPVHVYRFGLGPLLGHRFLVLVHSGRRTGRRRETPLEVVRHDPRTRESVVVAAWGRRTGWLHNVEAGLATEVWIGRDRFAPTYRILDLEEAEAVLLGYERRNRLIAPLVRAVISRLVGWRYDGSVAARRRLAATWPVIAFRPRSAVA